VDKMLKRWRFKLKRFFKNYGKKIVSYFLMGIVVVLVIFLAYSPVKNFFVNLLKIEKIKVVGVQYYSPLKVKNYLQKYKGTVNWEIDKKALKNDLEKRFKWIKSVAISNIPSRTLTVFIEEQEPIVFFRDKKGFLWVVGENGEILTKYTFRTLGYVYLPILFCEKDFIPYAVKRIKLFKNTELGRDFLNQVSEIIIKNKNSKWVLILNDFKGKLLVDPFGQFKNVDFFIRMRNRIMEDAENIDYVDLSFNNQLIVKKSD